MTVAAKSLLKGFTLDKYHIITKWEIIIWDNDTSGDSKGLAACICKCEYRQWKVQAPQCPVLHIKNSYEFLDTVQIKRTTYITSMCCWWSWKAYFKADLQVRLKLPEGIISATTTIITEWIKYSPCSWKTGTFETGTFWYFRNKSYRYNDWWQAGISNQSSFQWPGAYSWCVEHGACQDLINVFTRH